MKRSIWDFQEDFNVTFVPIQLQGLTVSDHTICGIPMSYHLIAIFVVKDLDIRIAYLATSETGTLANSSADSKMPLD